MRFQSGLFIHGVYWHDALGVIASHGCVNVPPRDVAFLYSWISPSMPAGWSELEAAPGEGAIVRVRDRDHPDPPPFDDEGDG